MFRPLLDERARSLCGESTRVVDSAEATAQELRTLLLERDLSTTRKAVERSGDLSMFVTDIPGRFSEVASRFLGRSVEGLRVEQIDL